MLLALGRVATAALLYTNDAEDSVVGFMPIYDHRRSLLDRCHRIDRQTNWPRLQRTDVGGQQVSPPVRGNNREDVSMQISTP